MLTSCESAAVRSDRTVSVGAEPLCAKGEQMYRCSVTVGRPNSSLVVQFTDLENPPEPSVCEGPTETGAEFCFLCFVSGVSSV